jgi:ADP-heptose:LPS heptosyltransferase
MLAKEQPSLRFAATAGSNPREQERLNELADACCNAQLQCFERLSIARLAALLQRCRLHVGADSGVLHLAVAMGLPTVTVFRRYGGLAEWMPVGKEHSHFIADCRCITENRNDCLRAGRAACLASITPAQVYGQICQQLL